MKCYKIASVIKLKNSHKGNVLKVKFSVQVEYLNRVAFILTKKIVECAMIFLNILEIHSMNLFG